MLKGEGHIKAGVVLTLTYKITKLAQIKTEKHTSILFWLGIKDSLCG